MEIIRAEGKAKHPFLNVFFGFVLAFSMIPMAPASAMAADDTSSSGTSSAATTTVADQEEGDTASSQGTSLDASVASSTDAGDTSAAQDASQAAMTVSSDEAATATTPSGDTSSNGSTPSAADTSSTDDTSTTADTGVWDGTADTSWYNTTATSFTISTPAQLAGLAAIVNGTAEGITADDFSGKTVLLGADVTLNTTAATGVDATQQIWTPIGYVPITGNNGGMPIYDDSHFFNGTFDGQGHVVNNIYCYSDQGYGGYQGLFGNLGPNAAVSNVGIASGYIYGRVAGGIAAISHASTTAWPTIDGCYNAATITGNGSSTRGCAGIFGGEEQYRSADDYHGAAYISNCYNTGTINGPLGSPSGGIAGTGAVQIFACWNSGSNTSTSSYSGALAGNIVASGCAIGDNRSGNPDGWGQIHDSYALEGTSSTGTLYRILDATHTKDGTDDANAAVTGSDDTAFKTQFSMSGAGADLLSGSFVDSSDGPILYWQKSGSTAKTALSDLSGLTVHEIEGQSYTGSAITPEIVITYTNPDPYSYDDLTLHQGSDFQATYTDNVNVGTATVTITGMGRYSGTLDPVTFQIVEAGIELEPLGAQWFYGSPVTPDVVVKSHAGVVLTEGTDYTLEFTDNDKAGTATVKATGIGSTTGEAEATFTIVGASTSLTGSGTAEDPYQIASKGDWQFVAHQINAENAEAYETASYKLTADVDLSSADSTFTTDLAADPWGTVSSWGSSNAVFSGTLDGDGHTITVGMSADSLSSDVQETSAVSLIGTAAGDAVTIKNLTLAGSITSPGAAAGFVGAATATDLTFESCTNKATVTGGQYYTGAAGFVKSTGTSTNLTMTDCTNEGAISSVESTAAGFVSDLAGGTSTFTNCVNKGTITSGRENAGGLVANLTGAYGESTEDVTFSRCANLGAVTSTGNGAAGGIFGYNQNAIKALTLAKCYNAGTIDGQAASGGLFGQLYQPATVLNCYNVGEVTTHEGNGASLVAEPGGIFGMFADNDNKGPLTLTNVYSAGKITPVSDDRLGGGIGGTFYYASEIDATNVYYNSDLCADAFASMQTNEYMGDAVLKGSCQAADSASMRSTTFPTLLSSAFSYDADNANNGYPVLKDREVKSIEDCEIASIPEQAYTGVDPRPALTVTSSDGTQLVEGTDYVVFYSAADGQGSATVMGIGDWQGTKTVTYAISKCSITDCTIDPIAAVNYADAPGTEFKPVVTVTSPAGTKLVEGTDYTVSYANNTAAGVGLVMITGTGDWYTGSTVRMFTIETGNFSSCTVSDVQENYEFSSWGPSIYPTVTAPDGTELEQGTDYTRTILNADGTEVTSTRSMPAGTYELVLTGTGSWTGEQHFAFTYGKDLATATVTGIETAYAYTGSAIEVTPGLADPSTGNALTADRDYTVAITDADGQTVDAVTEVGTYTVTYSATGKVGWYGTPWYGLQTATFKVVPSEYLISDSAVSGVGSSYPETGSAVTPEPTVTVNGTTLTKGTDYTVSYLDADGAAVEAPTATGTYTVVVTGTGAYAGVGTTTFSIDPVYFTVYTQAGDNGERTMVKQYTETQFKDLKADGDPISGMYNKGGTWNVVTAATYVTLDDLIADAGISDIWVDTTSVRVAEGASHPYMDPYKTDFEAYQYVYPNTGSTGYDDSTVVGGQYPVFALTAMSGAVADGSSVGATIENNVSIADDKRAPRFVFGISHDQLVEGSAYGNRSWSNCDSVTFITHETFEVADIAMQPYTGEAITPELTVTNAAGEALAEGTDYTVSYQNTAGEAVAAPTEVGTYTAVVTGVGLYTGTVSKTFQVVGKHNVIKNATEGGTVTLIDSADGTAATLHPYAGQTVTFRTSPDTGYTLTRMSYTYTDPTTGQTVTKALQRISGTGRAGTNAVYSFVMPDADVTLNAEFGENHRTIHKEIAGEGVLIIQEQADGTAATLYPQPGAKVRFKAIPERGYKLTNIYYTVEGQEKHLALTRVEGTTNVYEFTMPNWDVTLHAVYAEK